MDTAIEKFATLLKSRVFKMIVFLITSVLFGFGVWGAISIEQRLDDELNTPAKSYLGQYYDVFGREYYQNGQQYIPNFPYYQGNAYVYTGRIDYSKMENMDHLMNSLRKYEHIGGDLMFIY